MTLSPKLRHKLIYHLAELYSDETRSRSILAQASISVGDIIFNGSQNARWLSIIEQAENQKKLINLINTIQKNGYQEDKILIEAFTFLSSNYSEKLTLLTKAIKYGQCILFLGPGTLLYRDENEMLLPFKQAFANQLTTDLENSHIYYDKKERHNLSYISQRYSKIPFVLSGEQGTKAAKFFKENRDRIELKIYNQLAQLNFPLVINTNPDQILAEILNSQGNVNCSVRYYTITNNSHTRKVRFEKHQEQFDQNNKPEQLLYNVLGTFTDELSIITTESQLLNFTTRILREDPALDTTVTAAFDENQYYLFLGFDFGQWYMKILFDTVLRLEKKTGRSFSINSKLENYSSDLSSIELYEEEFKFFFINEDINLFLTQLLKVYNEN
jgi:hypothetical protein